MGAITSNIQAQAYVEDVRQRIAAVVPSMDSALMNECDNREAALFGALHILGDLLEPLATVSEYLGG